MNRDHPAFGLYVAGRWIRTGREARPVFNPATGQILGQLPLATTADLDESLAAAQQAFPGWRRTPAYARSAVLRNIGALIRERRDLFAATITSELGKPLAEALREADTTAEMFEWAAEECRRSYGRSIPSRLSGQSLVAEWEPIGPIAAFAPWNAPAITPARKISGALAAGCSVVIKPAEETPGSAVLIALAAEEAGLPPGVLNVVFGDPRAIADKLITSPVIRGLTFTGSTAVGQSLGALAGAHLKRMTLELGGYAPVIVCADADVESVASAAVAAKFRNAGQVCTSPTRFYIDERIYRRFTDRFVALARAWRVGDPFDPSMQMGPVANLRRFEAMARLTSDAHSRGVIVAAGGGRLGDRGHYWAPTVLLDPGDDCIAANEEPFGPLALLSPFSTLEAALAKANRLSTGLAAYAFTHDANIVARLKDELNVGTLAVNHWQASWPETPFGGRGDSGFGVEGGVEGLQAFQQIKFTSVS